MERVIADMVNVEYPVFDASSQSLRHMLFLNHIPRSSGSVHVGGTLERTKHRSFVRALKDVSFTIKDGERVGLIGHNGSGKTTLLRTLAGIYEPATGTMETRGRVMPLFNLTEGMSPDATGRELIMIRSVLLGLSEAETEEITPEVMEFAQLGDYIDLPVRTYSTGMLVRLAFAITTAVTSEILLFDELIGAGDATFVDKAQARLQKFVEKSSVMVVATHSADIMKKWCNRAMVFEHGNMMYDGTVDNALAEYKKLVEAAK
ncbi:MULTISPECIES: ABC transporter ATP-binding protein [Parvibaculaceae]|uniref:Teichoic acid export ATP-binding protein TagH n=1 Tax=Candidatus Phaeomarinibacter ectocarpi TaxID=1458461 RepID=X5M7Y3_9HYPH|nr:ABC transporter ATP-binding protein [Candidatus Phaeomarinobacter ectocarpi]CDO59343.1 Teichoic acid export ATP-binding protein TagH [Candidatus Phaeomarinobacter ectocarpi]